MKVVEFGTANKDVIILFHGGGLCWWNYREVAERLQERFHVVLPVLDGHAQSGTAFSSVEDTAARIIQWIDTRFQGHVLLIGGLSLGGQLLTEILSQRNAICDYAIIESAMVIPMHGMVRMIRPMVSLAYPLIAKRWFAKLQFRSLRLPAKWFDDYFRDSSAIAKEDMISFLTANFSYRIKESLACCKAKVLVLAGSKEPLIVKRSAKMLAQRLPHATLEILSGFGHGDLCIHEPELWVEKLFSAYGRQLYPVKEASA